MNSYLDKQIKFTYGKSFDEMTEEEKGQIIEITLTYKDFRGDLTGMSISSLSQFPNLKKCLISGFEINDDDIEVLRTLTSIRGIQFSGCDFSETTLPLGDVELVVLDGCKAVPKRLLQNNEKLRLFRAVNQARFDTSMLRGCRVLEEVYLQRSTLVNLGELKKLKKLNLVNLNGSRFNYLIVSSLRNNDSLRVEYEKNAPPDYSR